MVFKIMSVVIASIALFSAVGMFASVKPGQKMSKQQAGNSQDNRKFDNMKVVREIAKHLTAKDKKPVPVIDQTAMKVKVEQEMPVGVKFRSSDKAKRAKGIHDMKTKTAVKVSLKNPVGSKKVVLDTVGMATKVRLPSITESKLVRDDVTRSIRDIRNSEKAKKGAHERKLERSSVRSSRANGNRGAGANRKHRASVTVVARKFEKGSNLKALRKGAKSITGTGLKLTARARQTQLPFLSTKSKLHYQYTSRWPTTCPCELASGLLNGICWYFTGQGTSCRKRTCRRSYVCVIGAKTALTCMRKTLTERIVPNNDGTCRTEFVSGYMYKPYS